MKYLYHIFFLFLTCSFLLVAPYLQAQQLKLGNNPTRINKAAVLELQSRNQGLRLTRVDTAAVNQVIAGLSPAEKDSTNGMIVFQTSDSSIYYRAGGRWNKLSQEDATKTPTYPSRGFNHAYKISTTQDAFVTYTIMISVTQTSLSSAGQIGSVALEIKPPGQGAWRTVSTVSLKSHLEISVLGVVTLNLNDNTITQEMVISGWVPKGSQVQLVKTGDGVVSYISGQEVTM